MSNTRLFLAATLVLALSSAAADAADKGAAAAPQTEQQILVDTIRANRKAFIAVNLGLSEEEGKNFWPLYDKYQKEQSPIGDRIVAVIDEYTASFANLDNEKAVKLMQDYLAAEADRLQVRRAYLSEFAKVVSGRTVARFYQIENKMDAVIRYDLAGSIPVVDAKQAAPAK
jgi:hypothetical protein